MPFLKTLIFLNDRSRLVKNSSFLLLIKISPSKLYLFLFSGKFIFLRVFGFFILAI